MQSMDLIVIAQLRQWLQQGECAWLCTVIETWGSAPRRPGNLMVCNRAGVVVGSLSGGCIEEDLVEQLQWGTLADKEATYKIYGETAAEVERFKLPCGGTLGVLIEPFQPCSLADIESIESALLARKNIRRLCSWSEHQQTLELTTQAPALHLQLDSSGKPQRLEQIYGPVTHLFIIGISEVSRYLAELALTVGYRVTVCDPRPELAESWLVEHSQLLTMMPDDAVREGISAATIDRNTAIVALTHDPRIDDMGLMDAFDSDAFYIGAMGSKKSSDSRRQRLLQLNIEPAALKRLHAPIGLDIKSKTPVEIAISIIAELIEVRASQRREAQIERHVETHSQDPIKTPIKIADKADVKTH